MSTMVSKLEQGLGLALSMAECVSFVTGPSSVLLAKWSLHHRMCLGTLEPRYPAGTSECLLSLQAYKAAYRQTCALHGVQGQTDLEHQSTHVLRTLCEGVGLNELAHLQLPVLKARVAEAIAGAGCISCSAASAKPSYAPNTCTFSASV